MEVGARQSPEQPCLQLRRPAVRSFGTDFSLNKSREISGLHPHGPVLVRREKTQTSESQGVDDLDHMSTCHSPDPAKRFVSAKRERSIESAKPHTQVRMKSVLFRAQEKKQLGKHLEASKGAMFRLSGMFSTAATFNGENKTPLISASSYCVMLATSKKVVLGSNVDSRKQIASLTKLMTALTVFHICKQYSVDMTATGVKIDHESALIEGTSAGLKHGDQLSVSDMLHGMLLPSGNDAAMALANHFGKFLSCMYSSEHYQPTAGRYDSLKQFYDEHYKNDSLKLFMFVMNRMAGELGMKNTRFENPTGLQHAKSHSTAYDMALLSTIFSANPTLMSVVQKKNYHYTVFNHRLCTSKPGVWRNTNHLLWRKRDCRGGKTGYTPWAGPCLSSIFKIKHMQFVVVLLRSATPEQRFMDAERLYYWFKNKYLVN